MYCGVPTICPVRVSGALRAPSSPILARPKSMSFGISPVLGVGREEDVRRLEVAMDDAGRVRRVAAPQHSRTRDARPRARGGSWPRARCSRRERRAAHVLHDEEGRIADDEVEEARDVGMLDGRDRLGLVLEALAELGVGEQLGLEQLDRDAQADGQVLGDEHLAHGAVAERDA